MIRPPESGNVRTHLGGLDVIAVLVAALLAALPSSRVAAAIITGCVAGIAIGVWRAVRLLDQMLVHARVNTDVVLEDAP